MGPGGWAGEPPAVLSECSGQPWCWGQGTGAPERGHFMQPLCLIVSCVESHMLS